MKYYEVLVAHMSYHGNEPLTYSSDTPLAVGGLVRISLRERSTLGVILREVKKPLFTVKSISAVSPYRPLPPESFALMKWIRHYYPAPLGSVVRLFVSPTEVFPAIESNMPPPPKYTPLSQPELTPDQTKAVSAITGPGTFLLHGITGSGKSRVYTELAARAAEAGTSSLILTPEIGLTTQLTQAFRALFGDTVFVLHSRLTAAERRTIWYKLLQRDEPAIVIGPRSALFSPLQHVGLIVLDESHDAAYKNESAPHYESAKVAATLARLHGASLVLGSATPAVTDYYLATAKQRPIIAMSELARSTSTASRTHLIDMRKPELFSRNRILSNLLLEQIRAALERGEQTLLFLNRRGTANVVLCNTCGWQSLCPNCDLALTYHGDEHRLRCHVCGHSDSLPSVCPVCAHTDLLFKSIGTKAIVDAAQKAFPAARIQRFDTDTKKAERLEQQFEAVVGGSADIIVGTQMISKGLDLPKLSVVGIINADTSLLIPDYTASEQTYQLISQVSGRVGRGHRAGTVVVQTFNPENQLLRAALTQDWQTFYNSELLERKTYNYPPFAHLLKLKVLRASSKAAETAASKLASSLRSEYPSLTVDGPTPSFHPREDGKFSWQLLLKSTSRATLVAIVQTLPSGWNYDIDPRNLL